MQATKPVKDPRKQRKRLYDAPAHLRHKLMAAPLAPELFSKGAKTFPVRKGDTVRVVRGDHTGFEGKVNRVDLKRYRIFIEGLTREKVDGTNIFVAVHPSKVMIKSLKLDDKWRQAILENKKELAKPKKEKKPAKAAKKPAKKAVEAKEAKPAKKPKAQAVAKEKLPEKKAVKPKTAPKKPAAKQKKEEKPVAKKKAPPAAKKVPAEKEKKPKTAKKAPAKRKTATSKKKGGT
jgi:large subunit ribosomal protein L24